jgi:2-polyprenyl-6-hydroxyphenyl methylase/3-demethylubiquinone-9 3-methyltransferase
MRRRDDSPARPDPVLAPPAVAPEAYDESYYRSVCGGSDDWSRSDGRRMAGVYRAMLGIAEFRPNEAVVDIGTGRGELPVTAVLAGARHAIGVEYSPDAIRLAQRTAAAHGVTDRVDFVLADARAIPLPDGCADLVTMLDVVEHLRPDELDDVLAEVGRLLRPGGRLLVHTFPTATIYDVTYRWLRRLAVRRRWPADPRNDFERRMHVNEQSVRSLAKTLRRAGFVDVRAWLGDWVHVQHLPARWARVTVRALSHVPLARALARANVLALARRAP